MLTFSPLRFFQKVNCQTKSSFRSIFRSILLHDYLFNLIIMHPDTWVSRLNQLLRRIRILQSLLTYFHSSANIDQISKPWEPYLFPTWTSLAFIGISFIQIETDKDFEQSVHFLLLRKSNSESGGKCNAKNKRAEAIVFGYQSVISRQRQFKPMSSMQTI